MKASDICAAIVSMQTASDFIRLNTNISIGEINVRSDLERSMWKLRAALDEINVEIEKEES